MSGRRILHGWLTGIFLWGSLGLAAPAQVLVIRHAEKPDQGPDLSEKGRQRAEALVEFFKHDPSITQYGTPVAIFAAAPAHQGGSLRSIQTVQPLADSLGLPVRDTYDKTQPLELAREVMTTRGFEGRTVLIAWQHEAIDKVVKAFGIRQQKKWEDAVFDRIWKIEFDSKGVAHLTDLPQHLLPGDSQ